MVTAESTATAVALLQLLVSALGFVVVVWSVRVLVRSIDAQSSASVATRQLEFDKVILDNPGLYKYFYQSQASPLMIRNTQALWPRLSCSRTSSTVTSNNRGGIDRCGRTGCGRTIFEITSPRVPSCGGMWPRTRNGSPQSSLSCATPASSR